MGTRTLLLGKLNGGWVGHLGIMTWEIDGNLSHLLEAFEFFNKLGCLLRDLHKMKVEDCWIIFGQRLVWRYHQSINEAMTRNDKIISSKAMIRISRISSSDIDKAIFSFLHDSWPWPLVWSSFPGGGRVIPVKGTSIRKKERKNNESHGVTSPSHQQTSINLYFLKYVWCLADGRGVFNVALKVLR